ncbi:MAG: nucleoside monophosphate kinase [Patescibacteria group bacterium]|mgnify:CR=1 FL=1
MILVVGLAGSGKSTQCQMLETTGRYKWLSVGQLLRTKIEDPKHKAIIDSGDVLGDDTVLPLVEEYLREHSKEQTRELILDGFPRSLSQAKWLSDLKNKHQIHITEVIHIMATPETTLPRLLKRGRTDDHDTAIKERFSEYESKILPILDYLRDKRVPIIEVDGEATPETVHQQIVTALGR